MEASTNVKRLGRWVATVLILLASLLSTTLGQHCEEWNSEPEFCAQFDFWSGEVVIYVPEGNNLVALQEAVKQAVNYIGSLGDDRSLGSTCRQYWGRLACATFLRPCPRVNQSGSNDSYVVTPIQPCKSSCEDYIHLCLEYQQRTGYPIGAGLYFPPGFDFPLSCTETDTNGEAFYQSQNYSIPLPANQTENDRLTIECNSMSSNGSALLICEDPLHNIPNSNACGFTCPLPAYSGEQYNNIKVMQLVLGWLSWAGSLILALSYVIHPKLRRFPSNLILMAAVAAHLESVGMILPTFFGYDNTWCGFNTVYLMPEGYVRDLTIGVEFKMKEMAVHSGLCTFQGWLVQMGFLSSTMWWGIVALNMFLSVFFGNKLPKTQQWNIGLQVVFHVCGWAVPAFLMMVPAAADEIAFSPGASFCSLDSTDVYFLVFWGLPVGIILLVGTVLFVASLSRLITYARQLKELKKACGTYFRVILFILIYLVLIAFIFSYSLRVVTAKDTIEDGYSEYYFCELARFDNCTLSEEVHNYGLAVLRSIGYSSLGLMLFFNFCISPSMGRFWWRFFNHARQGKFSSIFTSEKTTGKSPGTKKTNKSTANEMMTMSVDGEDEVVP